MVSLKMNQVTHTETSDPDWKGLYRFCGMAALVSSSWPLPVF